jgi:hypothetical protein
MFRRSTGQSKVVGAPGPLPMYRIRSVNRFLDAAPFPVPENDRPIDGRNHPLEGILRSMRRAQLKYRPRSLRCYLRCARVLSLEPFGLKVTIRPGLQLRSKVTDRPNICSSGAIRRSSIAGMVQRLASLQVTRAGWLGSSWRHPASPRRGSLGPGGVALRASTPATPSFLTCF